MHWRRAGLVITLALLAACSPDREKAIAEAQEPPAARTATPPLSDIRPRDPMPARLLGEWVYSHEICDPDAEDEPDKRPIRASIWFYDNGNYAMSIEHFPVSGTYRYQGGQYPRIQLDGSLLNFDIDGDTLQNWGEGDAPYLCGRVFVRKP